MIKAIVPPTNRKRIVIVGGGFGGIALAKALRKHPFQVVLIDKHNYHTFQPLLYQVATGGLEPDSIAFPLRKIFAGQRNFIFRMAEVEKVDTALQSIHTNIGAIHYDYLVVATGTKSSFFGMQNVQAHSMGLKSVPEALNFRSLILQQFEEALNQLDPYTRQGLMQFVVVGGGPTGVEMAGALAELKRHVMPHDYPELDTRQMEIHLIEAGERLLAGMQPKSSEEALKALEAMDVNVWLNTRVKDYDGHTIITADGKEFRSTQVLWAAGVEGCLIPGFSEEVIAKGNRMKVDLYNRLSGQENIFVIGDLAYMPTEDYLSGHPQIAPVAIQQAKNLARNLALANKARWTPFEYVDKGAMATVGRNKAVVDFGNIHIKGFVAWLAWMGVHLLFLMGFRNKLVVFINWLWSYITYDKGARLIIRPFVKNKPVESTVEETANVV